jgi:hypothetical protein
MDLLPAIFFKPHYSHKDYVEHSLLAQMPPKGRCTDVA